MAKALQPGTSVGPLTLVHMDTADLSKFLNFPDTVFFICKIPLIIDNSFGLRIMKMVQVKVNTLCKNNIVINVL